MHHANHCHNPQNRPKALPLQEIEHIIMESLRCHCVIIARAENHDNAKKHQNQHDKQNRFQNADIFSGFSVMNFMPFDFGIFFFILSFGLVIYIFSFVFDVCQFFLLFVVVFFLFFLAALFGGGLYSPYKFNL